MLPIQITFHDMEPSPAVEARARDKAAGLKRFCPDLASCRVAVAQLHKHQQQGRPFGVSIDVTLPPHRELVVDRVVHEDVYVALRDAFDDMRRRLEDAVRRRRGDEKTHAEPLAGEVARLGDGFGFIRTAGGDEYWFSDANLSGARFDELAEGAAVHFLPDAGGEGPQARHVTLKRR